MSNLTDAIDAFLSKYPDDAEMTWRDPKSPRKPDSLDVMVGDLVAASEGRRKRTVER